MVFMIKNTHNYGRHFIYIKHPVIDLKRHFDIFEQL